MKKVQSLRNAVMVSLLAGTTVVWGGTTFAAENLQEFALEDMVVTATRTESKMVDVPVNTTVISAEKIADRHYLDVADALKDVPGANVLDTGVGAYEKKVVLNGDERVLVLVDGKRVNIDMGTMSRASYDLNQMPDVSLIERIEVVKGHGGALYGSDAVGGVINIITKKMDHSYGKVSMGFGSHQARDAKAMYTVKEGKTGVMVAASKYKQGYHEYKDAKTEANKRWPVASTYENEKVSVKLSQELSETSNLELGYDFSKFEGVRSYSTKAKSASFSNKKTNDFYAKYDWTVNDKDQGFIQLYRNKYDYYNAGDMYETDTGFEAQQNITLSDNNRLVVGASYRKAKALNATSYTAEKSINNKAVFVSDQWEFAPSWTLDAGVRYDKHSTAGSKTTWSAGLNKKFDENSHAYFNWGQVFKAPTLDDLYYYSVMEWGSFKYENYGNPNLKPEKGDTWTIGYGTKIADKTSVNISYFQSKLEDAIDWDTTYSANGSVSIARNVDKQKKNGMELSVGHELNDNWNLEASYTYIRVKNNDNGSGYVRDANYIPNMYRFGVRYHDDLWNADLFLRGGSGADKSAYVDSKYMTLDMSVAYKATKDLSFYAKGYNLFNKAYAESAGVNGGTYIYPAQGRRFIIGAEYTF
ncbi:MAG TPA: TonB-dependent receptor [Phascolarctobacterium succinatutens]|uniref:TonB-dependent receptor plug domain-containing protein n=1 Tax=Phascolarctobacterium succinatutens TaxID=626940 RepID=UPI000EC806C7|nr:TonB-dependent receptor [Phascolarctobacterium succinatutens]HAM92720.1 TonB-dependent receptor [Phascolarctobacterium succinatutens]